MDKPRRGMRLAAISAALLVGLISPAKAAVVPCSGTTKSRFDGSATSYQVSIFGARSNISTNQPSICGPSSVSVIWSMVAAASATQSNSSGWAQAGYGQFGSSAGFAQSGYLVFAQYTKWCNNTTGACASGYPSD